MGAYGYATVFAKEPDWKSLEELPFAIRVYQHRKKKLWVASIFHHRGGADPPLTFSEQLPFSWAREKSVQDGQSGDVKLLINKLLEIKKLLGPYSDPFMDYVNYLWFAADLARRAKTAAYLFSAN